MLEITIPGGEYWDENTNTFVYPKGTTLRLEHSLLSLSKWESKWHKVFLGNEDKTVEETIDYIRCMTLTQNVDPDVYTRITNENIEQVRQYIDDPMTATWFTGIGDESGEKKVITSEIVYYWMVAHRIPFECQKWHFNRLITLIQVCNEENKPKKKMSKKEFAEINAARRRAYKEAKAKKVKRHEHS